MIPSRGLVRSSHMAGLRKIILSQSPSARLAISRQFGTFLRSHGKPSFQCTPLVGALSGPRIAPRSASVLLQSRFSRAQQTRFNSTTPSASASSAAANGAASPVTPSPLDIDLDAAAFLDMPAQIGYLHAMGIDFGWGTSTMIQWLFEHIHVYSGLPWWASIVAVPVLFRVLMFKPSLTAAQQQAVMQEMTKDPRHLSAQMRQREALSKVPRDVLASSRAQQDMMALKQEYDIKFWRMAVPMLQIPIGFGMFRLTRAMSALPVPGMENGGLLWFQDLTVADPYFILPVVSAVSMFFMMKSSVKYMPEQNAKMMKMFSYVVTPIVLISTCQMASAVTWMLLVSTTLQIIQNSLFHTPAVRKWAGLPPLMTTAEQNMKAYGAYTQYQAPRTLDTTAKVIAPESQNPLTNIKKAYMDMKEKATEKASENLGSRHQRKAQEYEKRRALEEQEAYYRRIADAEKSKTIKDLQRQGKL